MGFWIFMLIMDMLIPITMILFGCYFARHAPKEINGVFGYRTAMSMKSEDTWMFAHRYFGNLWRMIGFVLFPLSLLVMLFILRQSKEVIGIIGSILCGIQMLCMLFPILPTEKALRKTFNKYGYYKNKL